MKKIYILLTQTQTRFSKFLRIMTHTEYTHVSIAFDSKLEQLYSFGRRSMLFPFLAGLVKEDPRGGIFLKFKDTKCMLFEVEISNQKYAQLRKLFGDFLQEQQTYKYNFLGLVFMKLNIPLRRERKFVCSQFVGYLLEKSGTAQFEKEYTLLRPEDFLKLEQKRLIYSGPLQEYANVSSDICA